MSVNRLFGEKLSACQNSILQQLLLCNIKGKKYFLVDHNLLPNLFSIGFLLNQTISVYQRQKEKKFFKIATYRLNRKINE